MNSLLIPGPPHGLALRYRGGRSGSSSPGRGGFAPRTLGPGGRLWTGLAFLWAAYFFLVFSLARYEAYTQRIIWTVGPVVALLTVVAWIGRSSRIPAEVWLLTCFAGWCLVALPRVTNLPAFTSWWKLVAEMVVLVWCISTVLRNSSGMHWFYVAFLGAGVFNVLLGVDFIGGLAEAVDSLGNQERQGGISGGTNALGFYCFMGILGGLALLGEWRSKLLRTVLLVGCGICLYGVAGAASKGAFLLTVLAVVLWPVLCFREQLRRRLTVLVPAGVAALIVVVGLPWIMENTFLGARLERARHLEEGSTQARLELLMLGLKLFGEHPVTGVGLGQFAVESGLGRYTHNEWAELLSNTGLVGFLLYLGAYAVLWHRLTQVLQRCRNPRVRYHANFGRLIVLLLLLSGMVFRPNFLSIESMFLIAVAVGTGQWVELRCRLEWPGAPGVRADTRRPRTLTRPGVPTPA